MIVFGQDEIPTVSEEMRKERPSYRDRFVIFELLHEPSPKNDIVAVVEREADAKRFEIDLSWLKAVDRKASNHQLLEDFSSWQVNW